MNLTAIVKTTTCALLLSILFHVDTKAQTEDSTLKTISLPQSNFVQFEALKFGNNIELKWRASSKGKGQFIIERSKDGSTFQKIGTVELSKALGTFNYVFTDKTPLKEKNFYRIKLSENTSAIFSNIATVEFIDNNSYSAYPTSTTSSIFIKIPKPTKIAIYNNQGNFIKSMDLNESQHVDVSDLTNGYYQIHFDGWKESVRFIKM